MSSDRPPLPSTLTYHNIQISGNAQVHLGNVVGPATGSILAPGTDFTGHYANSSPRPVPTFVPRPHLHQKIKERLHDQNNTVENNVRILVVYGLGGTGKSQLVLNYIRKYDRDYARVFWIEAGSKETIERDYVQIYRLLYNRQTEPGQGIVTVENAVSAVKQWFCGQKGQSLVVLDGADTIDNYRNTCYIDLKYFIPDAPGVHIVITSRCLAAKEITLLEAVQVTEMEHSEATELFQRSAKIMVAGVDEAREIDKIVRELGHLALAITLAGFYVSRTYRLLSDLKRYLPEYKQRRNELLQRQPNQYVHQYRESVSNTWEVSYRAMESHNPAAARLLSLLAFIHFEDIPISLFHWDSGDMLAGNSSHTANVSEASTSSDRPWQSFLFPGQPWTIYEVESAFETLESYSLIQRRPDQESYAMHKLVHAWGQDRLGVDQQRQLSWLALGLLREATGNDQVNIGYSLRLVPHVMANFRIVSELFQPSDESNSSRLTALDNQIEFLNKIGRWSEAYQIRRFHTEQMRKSERYGNEHRDTLVSASDLAQILYYQGKYEDSEQLNRDILETRKRLLGHMDVDTLISESNLAMVLYSQGKYEKAEQMIRCTLEKKESALGPKHSETLASLGNLATVLECLGKYDDAARICRKVLEIEEATLGSEHLDTLMSMNSLVWLLASQGQYEEAERRGNYVVEMRERILGRTHSDTLTALSHLAWVWEGQNKFKEAEELNREALRLRRETLGIDHPDTMVSAHNLASVLQSQGKYKEAEPIGSQTLALGEQVLGMQHPKTRISRELLVSILESQGK